MNDSMWSVCVARRCHEVRHLQPVFCLGTTPAIFAGCNLKEPSFFSDEQEYAKGFSYYRDLWDWDPAVHKVALEASTTYTKYPQQRGGPAYCRSRQRFPIYLHHAKPPGAHRITYSSGAYIRGLASGLDKGLGEHEVVLSRYANQLDQYTKYFPRESILLLTLEDYRRNGRRCAEKSL